MADSKLTQADAERLLAMLKKAVEKEICFPEKGRSKEFEVIGGNKQDVFVVRIYRGTVNSLKYYIGARIKVNGIVLLSLDINPNSTHVNPNGEKIKGSHWHIYTEEFGRQQAFAATDINDEKFVDNTILLLDKFNVIEKPIINFQEELF